MNLLGTVKAISVKNNSFLCSGEIEMWFTIRDHAVDQIVKKGQLVDVTYDANGFQSLVIKEGHGGVLPSSLQEGKEHKWEEDIVNYETLLNDAHEKFMGKFTINTHLISHDANAKSAVFKAIVTYGDNTWSAHGDCDQNNCGKMIAPHYIRMAETRAIARALRWATNNATTAEEEKNEPNI